jgi:uncharacterized protein YkwD
MIPIRSLWNDIATACSVVAFSVGVILLTNTTTPGSTPAIIIPARAPLPTSMPAAVVVPTLPTDSASSSDDVTSTDTASATPQVSTDHTLQTPSKPLSKVAVKTVAPKPPVLKPAPTAAQIDAAYMTEITRLIQQQTNAFRAANKLSSLKLDSILTRNATSYSRTLLAGNFLSHTDKSGCDMTCRFTRDGYTNASAWGENLADLKFSERPSAEYVASYFMRAWEKSAGHRENLLTPGYSHTGIGISMDARSIYVVVQFSEPK